MENKEINDCIIKIKERKLYHNQIPEEFQDDIRIIHAEVDAGIRTFLNRGYDVINNIFFIDYEVKTINYMNQVNEEIDSDYFDTFDDYYEYLNGDIYQNASYYKYLFNDEIIDKYKIDLSNISFNAFIKDNLLIRTKKMDNLEKKKYLSAQKNKKLLFKWKEKFCSCLDYKELLKISRQYDRLKNNNWDFILSSYALNNKEKNIPELIKLLLETDLIKSENMINGLCLLYDDEYILNYFNSNYWKRKSKLKLIFKSINEGSMIIKNKKYYDSQIDLYCIDKIIFDSNSIGFDKIKGQITYYYDTFDEFIKACNFDLTNANLSEALLDNIGLTSIKINENTKLPLSIIKKPHYQIFKYYDIKKAAFIVEEQWRASVNSPILKTREYEFSLFVDFVSFLQGDLSNADLLLCDGMSNITDFTDLNLTGALITSQIMDKLCSSMQYLLLPHDEPKIIEQTSKLELLSSNDDVKCHPILPFSESVKKKKVYYISDLHLDHHIQRQGVKCKEDAIAAIRKIAISISNGLYSSDILLIVGDTSYNFDLFKMFVRTLRMYTNAHLIFTLGNHELWSFKNEQLNDIIAKYNNILIDNKIHLLHNNIIYLKDNSSDLEEISEKELLTMDHQQLRNQVCLSPIIMFGGIGFSGLNNKFNANNDIYMEAVTREQEIIESKKIECLYTIVRNALYDREIIVATHMPLRDWSSDIEHHSGYVYINGHTHKNEFHDNEIIRIYADNQIGYYKNEISSKYFYIDGVYDVFADYIDGVYEITRKDYIEFYRGKNLQMNFNTDFEKLYMLKRSNYYCFIMKNDENLSILNGGASKKIKNKTIESCYDEMLDIINTIKSPLDNYTLVQQQVSNFVKKIGGDGRIHGTIVDIDYFNHIYINPHDLKITSYYAESMVNKIVYRSIIDLIEHRYPTLLPNVERSLIDENIRDIVLAKSFDDGSIFKVYLSTDIYSDSYVLKKMQKLYNNILTIWPESNKTKQENNKNIIFLSGK